MKRDGFNEVLRTAGSHGFADLVGVHEDGSVHFIQVKRVQKKRDAERIIRSFITDPGIGSGKYVRTVIIYIKDERAYVKHTL